MATPQGFRAEPKNDLIGDTVAGREILSQMDELRRGPRAKIVVHETSDPNDPKDVYAGVNGVPYIIKRGEVVDVPLPVALNLAQAMRTLYKFDPETNQSYSREAPAYPFTWIEGRPADL
mgnify:CR=1 FL=1